MSVYINKEKTLKSLFTRAHRKTFIKPRDVNTLFQQTFHNVFNKDAMYPILPTCVFSVPF